MTPLDLSKTIKKYKTGWLAIDEQNKKVIAHAKDFATISKKKYPNKNIVLLPASDEYFGLVT